MTILPLVSIITATYQSARFLEAAIASGRAQTYGDWEMTDDDDGSADGTMDRQTLGALLREHDLLTDEAEAGAPELLR